jgi:hypothetical protein
MNIRLNYNVQATDDTMYRARLLRTMRENNGLGLSNEPYRAVMSQVARTMPGGYLWSELDAAYAHGARG